MSKLRVAIIGNPNCGKSTIFNALSGSKQFIGNWPGVTVDKKTGYFTYYDKEVEVIDLPGIYSLNQSTSIDEKISQEFLTTNQYDLVINVIDSSNLARNLYLTMQLMELKIPMLVALNMTDTAENKGVMLDEDEFQLCLGIKAIKLIARKNVGIEDLKKEIIIASSQSSEMNLIPKIYPQEIIQVLAQFAEKFSSELWQILRLLEANILDNDEGLKTEVIKAKQTLNNLYDEDIALVIASYRYEFINEVVKRVIRERQLERSNISNRLDKLLLNRFIGIPIFFLVMYLMFTFSIVFGGALQNFFELFAEAVFIDLPKLILEKLNAHELVTFIIADGIGGGIQTVLTFVPIIGGLYLVLSFLEDSGYLARAAFLVDRAMRSIGLPGKAFFPLIVGFGCNVPAIMSVRGLNNERDRVTVAMMAPFMSCGARLSIYALFCAAFFPKNGQNIVFLLYLIGITVGILTALLLKKSVLKSEPDYLMLELPNYHLPTLRGVLLNTYDRLKSFVFGAGKLIVMVFIVLQFFNSVGFDFSFGNQRNGKSILTIIGKSINPIFEPMGIKEENWPASVGIFTGVFAKEVLVGSLNSLYLSIEKDAMPEPYPIDPIAKIKEAIKSVPENISNIYSNLIDPLWLNISSQEFTQNFLASEGVSSHIYKAMRSGFDGEVGAFSYLLFILLYFPCVSVFGIIAKEIGMRWAIFSAVWSTSIAYVISVGFYQCAKLVNRSDATTAIIMSVTIIMLFTGFTFVAVKRTGETV